MNKKLFVLLILLLIVSFSTQAFASLTFTSDAITGTTASAIDIGAGNTLSLQTTSNAPITIGTGLVTLGGSLKVAGLTATRIPFASTGGLLVDSTDLRFDTSTKTLSTPGWTSNGFIIPSNGSSYPLFINVDMPTHTGHTAAGFIQANSSSDDTAEKSILRLTSQFNGASLGSTARTNGLDVSLFGDSRTPLASFLSNVGATMGVASSAFDANNFGGDMIGLYGRGTGSLSRNIGVWGLSNSGSVSMGGVFYAKSGTNNIGVLGTLSSTIPTATSAAILADNGAIAAPIFLGRDNGVTKFSIKDGGTVNVTVATYADNAAALGGGLVAGDVYRTSTGVLMVVY